MGGAAAPGSAAAFRMITAAPCRELSFVCFVDFGLPGGATARPLGAGCLLAAMPLRDSSCPAGASPPYGWGVHLAGETAFSFVGKRGVLSCSCFFACPAGDCFSACPAGAKTTFSFACKRKSGSGLRKRKDRPVEIMGRYDTTGRWICAVMVSLGQKTLGYPSVSGGLRLSDLWSLLRHCR